MQEAINKGNHHTANDTLTAKQQTSPQRST